VWRYLKTSIFLPRRGRGKGWGGRIEWIKDYSPLFHYLDSMCSNIIHSFLVRGGRGRERELLLPWCSLSPYSTKEVEYKGKGERRGFSGREGNFLEKPWKFSRKFPEIPCFQGYR
jgi:hypothetical protein